MKSAYDITLRGKGKDEQEWEKTPVKEKWSPANKLMQNKGIGLARAEDQMIFRNENETKEGYHTKAQTKLEGNSSTIKIQPSEEE